MTRSFSRFALLLLAALTAALAASAATAPATASLPNLTSDIVYPPLKNFRIPSPERIVLPNGMVVLLLPNRDLPLVEGQMMIKVGSRQEPSDKVGLASMTGDLLRTGGVTSLGADAIDDKLEAIGASIETSIGEDAGQGNFSCLSGDLDSVLGVVAKILMEPAFAADRLEIAKTGEKSGIARRNDDVGGISTREFAKLVYGADSVYARYPEYATIDAITRDDVVAFHRANFHPNRVLLGLSGDFTSATAKNILIKHFGAWKKGPAATPFTGGYAKDWKPGVYFVEKSDVNQSNVLLGHLGTTFDNPDYFALDVMNEVFGGGFSARLFSNVRSKKGLAYAVRGSVGFDYDHPGPFRISLRTKSQSTIEGIRALWIEIDSIRDAEPSAAELDRAKSSILNSFVFNFDTRTEVLRRQLVYEFFGYPLDFLDRYRAGIEKVTGADVNRVAKAYIHPDKMVQLVVGKSADFDRPLSELGAVRPLDITIPTPAAEAAPAATLVSLARGAEVLDKAVAAMGGRAAFEAVTALKVEGEMTADTPMGKMNLQVSSLHRGARQIRNDIKTPMGMMTMVIDGDGGFLRTPRGDGELPAAQRADMVEDFQRSLEVILVTPGVTAQHMGEATIDGKVCDQVLLRAGDIAVTSCVGRDGAIVQDSFASAGPEGPATIVRTYSDWRAVGAIKLPYSVVMMRDGKVAQSLVVRDYSVNPAVSADEFKPAAAPAKP